MKSELYQRYGQDAEGKALADYRAALGTIITVKMITGYNDSDDSIDIDGIDARVRVVETPEDDLYHWVDEYLDPYWNVELVEPIAEVAGLRSLWTFGPSYRLTPNHGIVSAENNQSVAL